MGLKMKKGELKRLIKECVVEVLRENPGFRTVVKEAVADVLDDRMLVNESLSSKTARTTEPTQQRRRRPKGTNVPALVRGSQPKTQSKSQHDQHDEPTDLFEAIMADTMLNTLPDQIAEERSSPKSHSWEELVNSDSAIEEGPLARLRQAAMTPEPQRMHTATHTVQPQYMSSQYEVLQQPPSPIGEPSQAQLMEMFKQQQRIAQQQTSQQQVPQQQAPQHVPDDLAALGLFDKKWDAHIEASGHGGMNPNLAAIAAATNSEFASS